MNPSLSLNRRAGVVLAFALLIALPCRPVLADEKKDRAHAQGKELAQLREKLHDAQLELAKKNERIEDLEEQLVAAKASVKPAEERKRKAPEERGRKTVAEGKKNDPKAKPAAKAAKTAEAAKAAPKPQPSLFTVSYERNSAANLKERETALVWIRQQLEGNPALGLKIVGSANDTEYPEANREIATNRARFLGDYFVASGLPREAIVATEGTVAKTKADAGRSAVIQIVDRVAAVKK